MKGAKKKLRYSTGELKEWCEPTKQGYKGHRKW